MSRIKQILYFMILPVVAVLSFPPNTLVSAVEIIPVVVIFFLGIGYLLLRGKTLALTFAIFLQGMNVIIRIMLFFPNAFPRPGEPDVPFAVAMVIGLGLSLFLLLRLDRVDVRSLMIS
jgi:hypothetical protein